SFHTAQWRHDVELDGKRVAVIGTGCSAIQVVPAIQPIVEHVDVYQRSPGWTIPKMDCCKRIMPTDDWYPTLGKPNVDLVTDRVERVTPSGVRTADGVERRADVLVLA